jgi:hypothetical protein
MDFALCDLGFGDAPGVLSVTGLLNGVQVALQTWRGVQTMMLRRPRTSGRFRMSVEGPRGGRQSRCPRLTLAAAE